MDYKQVEKRMNDEIDRLSNLPDDLIHKILSYVGIKCAIETSALSSRWRYIWTSMPYLDFLVEDFSTSPKLSQFVTQVLSRRNNLVEVFSIKLRFRGYFSEEFVKQLLNYAFSHNIRQLDITWLYEKECANLKTLTLKGCKVTGSSHLNICHPLLSDLALEEVHGSFNVVSVVAPQLMNLTIRNIFDEYQYVISAPYLVSLCYTNYHHPLHLSTEGFHSLEKVDLCVSYSIASAQEFVGLFQQLQRVKYLTLNLEILELLSLSVELISNQPSPFSNLKSLHVYPVELSEVRNEAKMYTLAKNYLLKNSPSATFTMVSREEIRDEKNAKLAQKEIASLRVMLEREKTKTETRITEVENLLQIGGRMTHVQRSWEDLSKQIEKGRAKIDEIISELQNVKYTLAKLSISKRAEMQECFSKLCTEAYDVANKIMYLVKILCDMKASHFRVYFDELSEISEPSS